MNYLLSEDNIFIVDVENKHVTEVQAKVSSLFANSEMADKDMREIIDVIQKVCLEHKKYTSERYRKDK